MKLLLEKDILSFLQERLVGGVFLWKTGEPIPWEEIRLAKGISAESLHSIEQLVSDGSAGNELVAIATSGGNTCLLGTISDVEGHALNVLVVANGPVPLIRSALKNALEALELRSEIAWSRFALEQSAMQLAQSFEEQNWLRGFARNATSISLSSNANDIASRILKPLCYLMRAQDVFLLVSSDETVRSGLTSTRYGKSLFCLEAIEDLRQGLSGGNDDRPIVRNDLTIEEPEGKIESMVCVAIGRTEKRLGYLVAINRLVERNAMDLPVDDPEFGSTDVGLLEEAAVLLYTQAQNFHLLLQSNQLFLGTLHAMSSAIDARDRYTQGHSERVATLSFELAKILGLDSQTCHEIYLAGILHDIGKIGIPDDVLLKNGPLTDEEFAVIKQHPEIGYRIVQRIGRLQFALPGVLHHHERWDGRGYPHRLGGLSIPLMARIMAVADAFDAMTSSRPYRSAMPLSKAYSIITAGGGEQWDAEIVACFEQWFRLQDTSLRPTTDTTSIIPLGIPMEQMVESVAMILS